MKTLKVSKGSRMSKFSMKKFATMLALTMAASASANTINPGDGPRGGGNVDPNANKQVLCEVNLCMMESGEDSCGGNGGGTDIIYLDTIQSYCDKVGGTVVDQIGNNTI